MTSMYTLQDAYSFVNQFVMNGNCNAPVVYARITEACRRLRVKGDWPYTTQTVRIRVDKHYFPLPRECEKIIWCNVDNNSAYIHGMAYEFMQSGPGEIKSRASSSGLKDIFPAGTFSTMYDIPTIESFATDAADCTDRTLGTGYRLMAFSTASEDVGKELRVFGNDRLLNDVGDSLTEFTPGESVKINRWRDGIEGNIAGPLTTLEMSASSYRHLKNWSKPSTVGYITLYAVDPATNYMFLLAKAHPDDLVPVWRRYKVTVPCDPTNILALCKMSDIPLTRPADILPIQNLDAIKNMVLAIELENAQQLQAAISYEANATRLLTEQQQDHEVSGGLPMVFDVDVMLSGGGMYRSSI